MAPTFTREAEFVRGLKIVTSPDFETAAYTLPVRVLAAMALELSMLV
jgi:hypothetical protein